MIYRWRIQGELLCLSIFFFVFAVAGSVGAERGVKALQLRTLSRLGDVGISEPAILPNNPFYFLKSFVFRTRDSVAKSAVARLELALQHFSEKAAELEIVVKRIGNGDIIVRSLHEYDEAGIIVRERVAHLRTAKGSQVQHTSQAIVRHTVIHKLVLEELQQVVDGTSEGESVVAVSSLGRLPEGERRLLKNKIEQREEFLSDLLNRLEEVDVLVPQRLGGLLRSSSIEESLMLSDLVLRFVSSPTELEKWKRRLELLQRLQAIVNTAFARDEEKLLASINELQEDELSKIELLSIAPETPKSQTMRDELLVVIGSQPGLYRSSVERRFKELKPRATLFVNEGKRFLKEVEAKHIAAAKKSQLKELEQLIAVVEEGIVNVELEVGQARTVDAFLKMLEVNKALWLGVNILLNAKAEGEVKSDAGTSDTAAASPPSGEKNPQKVSSLGCAMEGSSVCGQDGKTYLNECFAQLANVEVASRGECKKHEGG